MNRLEELGRRVAEEQDRALIGVERRATVRRRVLGSASSATRRRAVRVLAVVAAAAALVLAIVALRGSRERAMTFTVGDDAGSAGAWISAPSDRSVDLRFSDGSALVADPAARVRVAAVDAHGAHVVVEAGALDAAVVRRAATSWRFGAGPFDVRVIGTAFRLAWDPEATRFTMVMREGSVLISGGIAGAGQALVAGEVLVADVARGTLERRPVLAPSVPSASVIVEEPVVVAPPAPAAPEKPAVAIAGWRRLAAEGKYVEALESAEKHGFSSLCASLDAPGLYQLGEVARLARNHARATEALTTLRKRFPGDARSAHAAFALGRVAFDGKGAYSEAATWFETYLREQPNGAFAREASGRVIEAHQRAGSVGAARAAAERYLATWPDGPHAGLARTIVKN
ncbi:MAG: tetratricopeptide repeat protein [Deltaproteobacteria bacterium]|nr:tetratricopeptide repeat protein [Deltaproteobacteria bacterium]